VERKTRFELATFSLARRRSTTELLPRVAWLWPAASLSLNRQTQAPSRVGVGHPSTGLWRLPLPAGLLLGTELMTTLAGVNGAARMTGRHSRATRSAYTGATDCVAARTGRGAGCIG
jgi:hypothetical protein